MSCLDVRSLTKAFGGLVAVKDVSFAVETGTVTGLIGPNGSGKTVTFDCITGFYRPDAGRVFFADREITGLRPGAIALRGIARSFQITGVFARLSVQQNLAFSGQEKRVLRNARRSLAADAGGERDRQRRIDAALAFTGLEHVRHELAANLPHGQQKILEFAGLMLMRPEPSLYMLDEPFAGLTQGEIARYVSLMREMRDRGKTFLLVEHNVRVVMNVCDRIVVLDHGERIADGSPGEVQANPRVVEAYLGHAAAAASQ